VKPTEDDVMHGTRNDTEHAIRTDPLLSEEQKDALLTVYRSYLASMQDPVPKKKS
jgi:hypothetical protein